MSGIISLMPTIIAIVLAINFKNVMYLYTNFFIGILIISNGNPITVTTSYEDVIIYPVC